MQTHKKTARISYDVVDAVVGQTVRRSVGLDRKLLCQQAEARSGVVAVDSPEVDMLEGRDDLAVLWDLRVAPDMRGKGVGSSLLDAAGVWAAARDVQWLKVETQNVNVPACRFYAHHDFALLAANRDAYAEYPEEIQLLWYKELKR